MMFVRESVAWVVCENMYVPPKRVRFYLAIFAWILGPAFRTEVGYGLGIAVEGINIFS